MMDFMDSRLSILNVAIKCGIEILKRAGVDEYMARCPFCGDTDNPRYGHLMLNVAKDAYHCVRCGAKGFAIGLYARLHNIDSKQAFRELMELDDESPKVEIKRVPQNPVGLEIRDRVYKAFLSRLKLNKEHLKNLIQRGLSWEVVAYNLYRSVPVDEDEKREICKTLVKDGYELKGVPGFYRDDDGSWTFPNYSGFFVPVRDVQGRIQGLQVRLDNDEEKKYCWFSSKGKPEGTPAHAWIGVSGGPAKTVLVTEGPLKADVAHYLSRYTFVAVPGVNSIRGIEQVLKELYAERVYIAFDADKATNIYVKKAEDTLKSLLEKSGFDVRIKDWDRRYKGIDDYLLALRKEKVRRVV